MSSREGWTQGEELVGHAVCALFLRPGGDGRIEAMAISRGADMEDWGLPGGKVEAFESAKDAAIREAGEETGIIIRTMTPVYTALATPRICTTFLVNSCVAPKELKSEPFEGYVKWVDIGLLVKESCSFSSYNSRLFSLMNLI